MKKLYLLPFFCLCFIVAVAQPKISFIKPEASSECCVFSARPDTATLFRQQQNQVWNVPAMQSRPVAMKNAQNGVSAKNAPIIGPNAHPTL